MASETIVLHTADRQQKRWRRKLLRLTSVLRWLMVGLLYSASSTWAAAAPKFEDRRAENGQLQVSAMGVVDVNQIIETVIRNDQKPPSEEYSAYAFGAEVARQLDPNTATVLIVESFRSLPASLAASFLNGVLDHFSMPGLTDALFAALPQAAEVSAGGTIVRFLVDRAGVPSLSLVTRLISDMQRATDPNVQNVTAFAIWKMLGDRHSTISTPETEQDKIVDVLIDSVLNRVPQKGLSEYTRSLLQRCRW